MMETLLKLLRKYREIVLYIFFGVLTTAVNVLAYLLCTHLIRGEYRIMLSTVLAWTVSVLFAYATNRTWVFRSSATGLRPVLGELTAFVSARLFSGLADMAIMYVFAVRMGLYDFAVKVLANVVVVILNYILSKWIVFRKK